MSSSRQSIIDEQLTSALREIIEQLPAMKLVFQNPNYDLNETVENESDFLLGVVLGEILERCGMKLLYRQIRPTDEEIAYIHLSVFTQAHGFKTGIKKILGF